MSTCMICYSLNGMYYHNLASRQMVTLQSFRICIAEQAKSKVRYEKSSSAKYHGAIGLHPIADKHINIAIPGPALLLRILLVQFARQMTKT